MRGISAPPLRANRFGYRLGAGCADLAPPPRAMIPQFGGMAGLELNADIGEGWDDARLLPYVQRASIACGGHVGDAASMARALELCAAHGVMAGAHPSFPDLENFGRVALAASGEDIERWVVEQVAALRAIADAMGVALFHVKPHGALYNLAAHEPRAGRALVGAMARLPGLALVALADTPLVHEGRARGITMLEEAFADRRYLTDGRLAPRHMPGAVIDDPRAAAEQARRIAGGEALATVDGGHLVVHADTLCLHGDRDAAEVYARAVHAALRADSV